MWCCGLLCVAVTVRQGDLDAVQRKLSFALVSGSLPPKHHSGYVHSMTQCAQINCPLRLSSQTR